jgi:hypothetical protein
VWRLSLARNRFTEIPHTSVARLHKLNYLDLSGKQEEEKKLTNTKLFKFITFVGDSLASAFASVYIKPKKS